MDEHPNKRLEFDDSVQIDASTVRQNREGFLQSFSRHISPPPQRTAGSPTKQVEPVTQRPDILQNDGPNQMSPANNIASDTPRSKEEGPPDTEKGGYRVSIQSPFRLTSIRDLPSYSNIDAITLHDILGNPLIKEAWVFNFYFDVDWMMTNLHPDIRHLVQVKIIHGSWRREDGNKLGIDDACRRWKNVEPIQAYLPDAFGTHHSKMFVLFSHDECAEVIIHTANMLAQDWRNMTQAVWRSGPLARKDDNEPPVGELGSGSRFKYDLMNYFRSYGSKLKNLVSDLREYDFSPVRGALVASVPSKLASASPRSETSWGHCALGKAVERVNQDRHRSHTRVKDDSRHVVCQVSSIASFSKEWFEMFRNILLSSTSNPGAPTASGQLSIIYPTPNDVSRSLDGYASGGSIHTKCQSAAHLKQIEFLRSHFCQWVESHVSMARAHRHLAAPHIKTYICFNKKPTMADPTPEIRWALLTSANLSTQAWGALPKGNNSKSKTVSRDTRQSMIKTTPEKRSRNDAGLSESENDTISTSRKEDEKFGTVHIQSYEIGVLVWPELFRDQNDPLTTQVKMVPSFLTDQPPSCQNGNVDKEKLEKVVAVRLPYDLPLTPYGPAELPWSPQAVYDTPDRFGRRWPKDFF